MMLIETGGLFMKRMIIGGFISLAGTIWGHAITVSAGNNMDRGWSSPPGRFLTTIMETGMAIPMTIALLLLLIGLAILGIEYFRNDEKHGRKL